MTTLLSQLARFVQEKRRRYFCRPGYVGSVDPVAFSLSGQSSTPFTMEIPRSKCRWPVWSGFDQQGRHPLYRTACELVKGTGHNTIVNSLENFYMSHTEGSALAFSGLNEDEAPGLASLKLYEAREPWDTKVAGPRSLRAMYRISKNRERLDFYSRCPPANRELARRAAINEVSYLGRLYESIKKKGYRRNSGPDGDIKGDLLTWAGQNGHCYVVVVRSGQHRLALLLALEKPSVPVRVANSCPRLIRSEDVLEWENVKAGVYSPEGALKLFYRYAAGSDYGNQSII